MEEDDEYDSDDSDGTVLLTDYVDNPQKTDMKRRRLSNLHDRPDEFEDENIAPEDISANRREGNSPEKKKNNVDKNWHISKYFACISKNNDTNIQNNNSKTGQKHGNISKGHSTNIDNDDLIYLDSDDESQIDNKSQDQDRKSVKISARNERINNPNMKFDKPAPVTTRKATATTDILERNKMQFKSNGSQILEENKRAKIRILKPSAINARRATAHFEENDLNSNLIGKTTSILKNTYTGNKNEIESDVYRSTTPRLPESQSADGKISINADCNNITGIRTAALDNIAHISRTSPLPTSNKPMITDIDQNNGLSNKDTRQGTNVFLNVQTQKRFGSNNEIQMEPKRIKIDAEPTNPAQLNKNTPRKDIKVTALKETKKFEACQPFVNLRKEMHVPSAVDKVINDHLETERTSGHYENKTSEVKNTTGAISEKGVSDDAKSKTASVCQKSDNNKPNKDIHTTLNTNEKLAAGKIYLNVSSTEHKTLNAGSERNDGCDENKGIDLEKTTNAVKENRMQYGKTLYNVCENRETPRSNILQEPSTSCDKEETAKLQYADVVDGANHKHVINQVQDKQITSELIEKHEASKVQDDQGTDKVVDELETTKLQDEQGNLPQDEEETNKEQYYFETTEAHHKHAVSKVQHEHEISVIQGEAKEKQQVSKILSQTDEKKTSDKQEINKALNDQVMNELNNEPKTYKIQDDNETIKLQTSDEHYMNSTLNKTKTSNEIEVVIDSETNDNRQETDKVNNQLKTNNVHVPSESLDKRETSEASNAQEGSKARENNVSEMHGLRQEPHKERENNENETTESSNVQETVKENVTTRKASRDDSEDNDRVLKFQVGFFTLIKEYLKDIFPESAMELHNLIETLIINTRNGQVQTDVKYSCLKCSHVSNYSSRVLNNLENEENVFNADGYQKCGFCNGTRKLHNSYLKRFLSKKYSNYDKNEDLKVVSPGKDQTKPVEQSRNSFISNSQTTSTSEDKTDNNFRSTSAVEDNSLNSIINNDKQVRNHTLTQNNWKENTVNNHSVKKHPVPNETPSINMSQLDIGSSIDNNVVKDAINKTTSHVSGAGTVKLTDKETADKDTPITKENEICTQSKPGHFGEESTTETDLGLSNKRKNYLTDKETTDYKRIKTSTEETNYQRAKNLTAEVTETSTQRNDALANDRPDKIQIISIRNITSHRTQRLNSSLQNDPSIDTGVNRAANSELCNENTPEKSSNGSLKEFKTNTSDRKEREACLNPKRDNSDNIITAEAEQLHERSKYFSEDGIQAIEGKSSKNISKERQSEVDENGKGKSSNNTSTESILETNETNVNQVRHTKQNNQANEDILKPLMDCFAKIKNSMKEKEDTPIKDQKENKTQPLSASKIRPMIRGNRSNSLDNLQNRDGKKIVIKYVCPICTSMYVYASKLLRHMQERHNPNLTKIPENCERLQCPFCRALLSNKSYNKHVKLNHPEKLNENVGDVENRNNTNKSKNEKPGSIKNKVFLNCGNTESNKSESTKADDIKLTSVDTTRQQKNQRRSECKYQHLIRRIKIGDVNHDKQDEIPGEKNENLDPRRSGIGSGSPTVARTGDITSNINSAILHHTEWCRGGSNKSSDLKSAATPNSIYDEQERTPSECNDRNIETIKESNVNSLHNDNMHDTNATCYAEKNDSKSDETKSENSYTSEESIIKRIDNEEHSSRKVSNEEKNESETSNNHGLDNDIVVNNGNETLTVTCTVENGKHGDELSIRYINHGKQSTENTAIEGSQTSDSNTNKEKEIDNEDDCIKASDYTVKKRKERTTKLFGDDNEVSVSSKIKESKHKEELRSEQNSKLDISQKEHQTPKDLNKKTSRQRGNRKTYVVQRRRKVTIEQSTESEESSDSDWIISNDESSDSCDEYCSIKKLQVVKKLFSSEIKPSVLNGSNEDSSTESGDNNNDSDEETIKSRYTVMKKNKRLSRLFSDDNELSLTDEISKEEDRQAGSDKNDHRSDRQCVAVDDGSKKSVPSNNEQEVPSDNETLKISEHTVKKRMERISKQFGVDNETLVHDSNQQMENSDMNADDGRTKVVNVSAENNTQCYTKRTEMRDDGANNENCVNKTNHEEISSRKIDIDGATDPHDIIAVAEEENMNAVRNTEKMSRDDDRIEINMIDRLLKELADDHQNGARADKEYNNEDNRKSEISGEYQATSESAPVKTCLDNIRITNVTSVDGKTHVFICQECNYGTDAYDDAIRHCQNHYNLIEDQVTYCDICQINYDTVCFERHQSSHDKYLGNIKIKFSYHWLFTNWQVVFENNNNLSLSEAEHMQVKSIYKTFCVKMAVKEDGPWQTAVYLCANCNTCVPPLDVERHSQQKCTFVYYPCRICDRVFSTYDLRKHHELYHTDDAYKLFKTIVFNGPNDESFNSKLIQVKTQSREKQRIVDIFKCLCGLCFISLKKFKLHFADCDPELNDGRQCPSCTGIRLFSTTELEEHVLLHHSSLNYEFRVQKITFQLESIIESSERETPSETSNGADNATQMTWNDEDLNIKRDILKDKSFTQTTDEQYRQENLDNTEEADINRAIINETVPGTSDNTTNKVVSQSVAQITLNDENFNTKSTDGENRPKNTDRVEKEDINRRLISETVPGINDEDLIIKRDMLKDETVTQDTNEENSQKIPDTDEKEDISRKGNSQEITAIEDSENTVDTEASQEVMVVEESVSLITIEGSQEMEVEESTHLITVEDSDDDVEFVGETFPNLTKIFPLRYCSKR